MGVDGVGAVGVIHCWPRVVAMFGSGSINVVWHPCLSAGGVGVPRSRSWLIAMSVGWSVVILIRLTVIGVTFASTSTAAIMPLNGIKYIFNEIYNKQQSSISNINHFKFEFIFVEYID